MRFTNQRIATPQRRERRRLVKLLGIRQYKRFVNKSYSLKDPK
jgi:hypothetical protein